MSAEDPEFEGYLDDEADTHSPSRSVLASGVPLGKGEKTFTARCQRGNMVEITVTNGPSGLYVNGRCEIGSCYPTTTGAEIIRGDAYVEREGTVQFMLECLDQLRD